MIMRKLTQLCFVFGLGMASMSYAGETTVHQNPAGSGIAFGPVVDSTERFFPQIDDSLRPQVMSPANPKRSPIVPQGVANNILAPVAQSSTMAAMGPKFPGIGFTGWNPPDPHIAVGYNHIVEVVNTDLAFFDKAGNKQFQQHLDNTAFFSGVAQTNFVFDPKVVFDSFINRFIVIAVEERDSPQNAGILIAISDDGNPNGSWTKYRINAVATKNAINYWFDYPTVGSNKQGLVICGNQFSFGNNNFGFARSYTLRKTELAAGGVINYFFFDHPTEFTLQPAKCGENVSTTIYGSSLKTTASFSFYAWRNFQTTPVFSMITVAVPSYLNYTGTAASVGSATLDPLSDRMMDTFFRSGSLLMSHTVRVSAADNRPMVRWYEYLMQNWPVSGGIARKQFGNVNLAAPNYLFMPAIAKNGKGAISILLSRSSSTRAADLYTVSHKSTDALNSMGPLTLYGSSNGQYSPGFHRWGDYFGIATDPSDASKFWGVGELINSGGIWKTEVRSWTVN